VSKTLIITHYYHSGFSVADENVLLVFDYWRGEEGELTHELELTGVELAKYRNVYVFISHEHIDHMDPIVFSWKNAANVSYIVSSDMPVGTRGKRMAPGDTLNLLDGLSVTAFDSTDLGVSFLINWDDFRLFHAGDLNYWHWREESTMQEIEESETEFRKAIEPLTKEHIDLAFFPVDPRQGYMYDAGANYFIIAVKPTLLIPMHYFHRADVAMEFARTAGNRNTEVVAMPGYGDIMRLDITDDGYFDLSFPKRNTQEDMTNDESITEEINKPEEPEDNIKTDSSLETIYEDDPFIESDLPLSQLASDDEKN
jgi:L-ascorbate metabolism protein UlaG (beta-lactamase superfamily)